MGIGAPAITRIGEVIESSTTEFVAQCYELHQPPPFGSLVKTAIGSQSIFAVVYLASTVPAEPGRRPIARGRDQPSEEEVYRQHPQLAQLLRTEFRALVVAYREAERSYTGLPPFPPRIHSFVYICEAAETVQFSQSMDFLSLLVRSPQSSDELVAACLRGLAAAHDDGRSFLVSAGKELARLLAGDPQRLNSVLRRMRP